MKDIWEKNKKKLITLAVVLLLGLIGVKLAPEQSEQIACGVLDAAGSPCEAPSPATANP